ncbi:hypothetical protein AJ80_07832 [Polytolypa hystricis UAMH7299]|uniref:FAD dependent oxidoreductase domain-containing protein n=1 Tax=Polytolypa hystricis (strain UAMH7299) TaxID=1447883 RepID=A0A2B7XIJ5_POLH7|nr:hypothetical protein AJ80_07832 [Polytolypa hystricis UAMH7299]
MEFSRYLQRILSCLPPWIVPQEATPAIATRPEATVILGAGVIGLSTAYYLALALNETISPASSTLKPPIIVVDSSPDVCSGASGEATGGLGDFGFITETAPLGNLSYALHKGLTAKFNGTEKYQFSDLEVFRVSPKDFAGIPSPPDSWGPSRPVDKTISDLPPWIRALNDWKVQSLAAAPHAAHLGRLGFFALSSHRRWSRYRNRNVFDNGVRSVKSNTFYRVFSAVLIADLVGPPIAYGTLRHSLWLPYLACGLFLSLTYPVLLYMPETLQKTAQDQEGTSPLETAGVRKYLKFLTDWKIFIGVTTVFLAQFRNNTIEILLPYTSVRFGLKLGEAATLLSVVSAVNIVVFLVLLPAVSRLLQKRAGWSITFINICVARVSSALLVLGAAILSVAPNIGIVVVALIIYAAGFGVRLSILAVLTSFVNSAKETAQLYTLVATTDAIAHMVASPLLQRIWSIALNIGGRWLVLPFLVLMGIFIVAFLTSCLLMDTPSSVDNEDILDEAREPLLVREDD